MIPFTQLDEERQQAALTRFFDLFSGRLDTYAIRVEMDDRAIYVPSRYEGESEWSKQVVAEIVTEIGTDEFCEQTIRAHLEGKHLIGVYPINSESKVNFFALDFDGKNGDPYAEARAQAMTLSLEATLPVYIERSQSGNGFHVWGFFEQPIEAYKVRHALKSFIETTDTFDRMFPNQNGINDIKPLGNLIALPLSGLRVEAGNSSFVFRHGGDGTAVPFPDQFDLLDKIKLIPVAKMEELFEAAGEFKVEREQRKYDGDPEGLTDGWKVCHPKFGCEFMEWAYANPDLVNEPLWYAIACNLAQVTGGRDLFHEISAQDVGRYDPNATDRKYDQALRVNAPHTCEKIRELGGNCNCDSRFPGKVYHPFDLAKLSFKTLVKSVTEAEEANEAVILDARSGFAQAIEWIEAVQRDPTLGQGRAYGISGIDAHTGLRDSDLLIIAARPGMGKTAFMNTVIDNTCVVGVPNYAFSAEMSGLQFFKRQLSTRASVSQTRMGTGQLTASDWVKINDAKKAVADTAKYPLFVDDLSRSTDRIFEVAARLVHQHGKGIVWIDYLQLLQRLPKESMFDAVTRVTHDLKLLAKALDVPVVALTQLNRTADDATSESQTMDSWLRGSGDIEQAADVIAFLLGDKGPNVQSRTFAIHKERHREGGGRVDLEFNQPFMRFADKGTWGTERPKPEIKRRPGAPTVEGGIEALPADLPELTTDLKALADEMGLGVNL